MKLFDLRNLVHFSALSISTIAVVSMAGCGGHSTTPIAPEGNTTVTVLLSSTANDRLTRYELDFQDLTLTSQAGKTVSLLTTAQNAPSKYIPEFMHLNGATSTLLTASVPDDTYTSASLTVGGASITCIAVNRSDNSLTTSIFAYGQTPQSQVTVNLPAPIVVSGDTTNLSMQLDGLKSYTLDNCLGGSPSDTYSITPTFNLTAADLSSSPTNYLNGKETNVLGQVSAVSSTGFSVALGYSYASTLPQVTQSITANSSTAYQGVSGLTALTQGAFVDMDLAAQSDGSLLATRVAVHDPAAVDVVSGPVAQVVSAVPAIFSYGQQVQGPDQLGNTAPFDLSKATFSISQQYSNLANLPFTPNFEGSNLVPGQNVYITTPASTVTGFNRYPLANTMTLMPQTVDGVVTAIDSSGDFDVYTITLASYDLFPALAGQQGATNLISAPQRIVVYADGNASQASTAEPAIDRKSTRLNSSHDVISRMPSSA